MTAPTYRTQPVATANPTVWLSVQEAADRLRRSRRTVERHIAAGNLPAYQIPGGRALMLRTDDVDRLPVRVQTQETGK